MNEKQVITAPVPEGPYSSRKYKISRSAIRTKWYDEQLLAALSQATHPLPLSVHLKVAPGSAGISAVQVQEVSAPRQVVLLGAGMDSRAWRLPLAPGE